MQFRAVIINFGIQLFYDTYILLSRITIMILKKIHIQIDEKNRGQKKKTYKSRITKIFDLCPHLGQEPLFEVLKFFPRISRPLTRLQMSTLQRD